MNNKSGKEYLVLNYFNLSILISDIHDYVVHIEIKQEKLKRAFDLTLKIMGELDQ